MYEIKCPNCGKAFTVDESDYAEIVRQARDSKFRKAVEERERQLEREKNSEIGFLKEKA